MDASSDYEGECNSLVMDSNDLPHIGYSGLHDMRGALKYARFDGIFWTIEIVDYDPTSSVGYSSSIDLDSDDGPHISYRDIWNMNLKYAYWNGTAWLNETVDSEGEVGITTSIRVDSLDRPHIAYFDRTNNSLKYAYWNGTGWKKEVVDIGGFNPSLVLDSKDNPHITHHGGFNSTLRYAHFNGTSWTLKVLDPSSGALQMSSSLDLDSNEYPHVAYGHYVNESVTEFRLLSWNGSAWTNQTIDTDPPGSGHPRSLKIDSRDRPHLAYIGRGGGGEKGLYYYYWNGVEWEKDLIDDRMMRSSPSLALDSYDSPHISYSAHGGIINLWYAHTTDPLLPDLKVLQEEIFSVPHGPVVNDTTVNVYAFIRNAGFAKASNVSVSFYDGPPSPGNEIGQVNISMLLPQSLSVEGVSWNAEPLGVHDICVYVDPNDTIAESNESNNMACTQIEVVSDRAPLPPMMLDATLSGSGLENIISRWNLSADDGGGSESVVRYDIYRSSTYHPKGSYPLHDSVPNGTSYYADIGAGEGDPSNYFCYVCAVNTFNNSSCSSNQAGKFTRPLPQGPNLISIPLIQSNESIEYVLQTVEYDKAWYYDSFSKEWKWYMKFKGYRRGLWNVNHTMGLWINVTGPSSLTVAGVVPAQTTITLYAGWNLVSFPSFNTTYTVSDLKAEVGATRVEGFDGSAFPHFLRSLGDVELLQAGQAYWVRVEADMVWTVFNP